MTNRVLMVAFAASLALALGAGTAAADAHENPCGANPCNPCGDNPCGTNPCDTNPCGDNPCNPCGDNPCGGNPCGDWEGDSSGASDGGDMGLVTPTGKVMVSLTGTANLGEDAIFEPFSLAPDIWYGAAENLAIGIIHSSYAIGGFIGAPNQSLCLTGDDKGCPDIYTQGYLEGRYQFWQNDSAILAAQVAVGTRAIDPFVLAAKVGLMARILTGGPVMIDVNPNVNIAITERDGQGAGTEIWNLPINLMVMAAPNIGIMLQTGITSTFEDVGDNYAVPVTLGAMFWATPMIGIAAAFTAGGVLTGADGDDAFDRRSATLAFIWRQQ